ncbi:MAG: sigma 54-interacting transcriptional regulator [bacterium]
MKQKAIDKEKKHLIERISELETLVNEYQKSEKSLRIALRKEFDNREKIIEEQTDGLIAANVQLRQENSERKKAEEELRYRVEFEKIITTLSTNFIKLSLDEIDTEINIALETIGKFVGVDRSYVFLFKENEKRIDDVYEWRDKGIKPQIKNLRGRLIDEEFPWFAKKITKHGVFHVSGFDKLPPEADAEKKYLLSHNIQSLIAVPMFCGSSFIGFVGFDSVRTKKKWELDIIALLRIVGEIFANALERKWMDTVIRENEKKYRLLFECESDGIAVLDMGGNIIDCNKAYTKILGFSRKEIIGKSLTDFLSEENNLKFHERLSLLKKKGLTESEIAMIRKDGQTIPVWCKATAIYDEHGNIKSTLTHCRYRTKNKKIISNDELLTEKKAEKDSQKGIHDEQHQMDFVKLQANDYKTSLQEFDMFKQAPKKIGVEPCFKNIISRSHKIGQLFDILPSVAESISTVLIQGESGTGKHLFAQAIHNLSPRRDNPFIIVNCGALPDTLLESELFGYKAGAFTDAKKDKPGRFALADGGTLFLDEIGDISSAMQVRLLRFLQERIFEPLGSVKSVKADVRIIAATNKNLMDLVKKGKFREDLFYRINVVRLDLPPLRGRLEDVPLLIDEFITKLNLQQGKNIKGIKEDALICLLSYDYPGNIRELENIIERSYVICNSDYIERSHLPEILRTSLEMNSSKKSDNMSFMKMEAAFLINVLRQNNWNRLKAARQLGIHKATLYRKIKSLGLKVPQKQN